MRISIAVISSCEAILLPAESPGVIKERDLVAAQGGQVFYSIDDVPSNI